ncbi:MAG: adenosine kinase [Bacteroidales bacterium]|nr:adenosine kinase [Bacteroidales bacterium]
MKVLGIGNALVDVMTRLEDDNFLKTYSLPKGSMQLVNLDTIKLLEKASEKLDKKLTSGGSAANTIHGLAKLGIQAGYIGKIGKDNTGEFFKQDMVQSGVNTHLLFGKEATGRAIALISPDSERTFATYLGAAVEIAKNDLTPSIFENYDFLHVEGYLVQNHELIEEALKLAKKAELKISLDLASFNVVEEHHDFLRRIVNEYVDVVFANEEEARAFTGKSPEDALVLMACLADIAVVKTGKNGSMVKREKETYTIKPVQVNAIDTTGAGDLYATGFLYGLLNHYSIEKCGEMGSFVAGKVIEIIGAKMDEEQWINIRANINKETC